MRERERERLFDDGTGCLTDWGLGKLMDGSLEELERLEAAEHLAFCDSCVERYTALLSGEELMPAPELLKPGVLQALRRRAARVLVNRYFHMAVAACLTLVLWGTGFFWNMSGAGEAPGPREALPEPRDSVSSHLSDISSGIAGGLNHFLDDFSITELRGAFSNEKE